MKPPLIKRFGRGVLKLTKWLFILALVGVAGLYGYVRYDYSSSAGELAYQMDRAKELGLPLEPSDMERHPPLKNEDNAASLYREMAAKLEALAKAVKYEDTRAIYETPVRQSSEGLALAESHLAAYAATLDIAFAASQKPDCDFQRDWSQGPEVLFPEFARQKDAIKLLCSRALIKVRSGRFESGVEDLRAAGRIAAHAGSDKILIGGLVAIAADAIAVRAVESAATFSDRNIAKLTNLRETLQQFPAAPTFEPYLKGEVFFGFYTARNLYRFSDGWDEPTDYPVDMWAGVPEWIVKPPLMPSELVEEGHASTILQYWNDTFEACEEAHWQPFLVASQMDRAAAKYERTLRPSEMLLRIILPVFAQAGFAFEKMKAGRDCTRAMIDVLLFKNRHGRLPKALAEAGIKAIDPFDEKPLKYRITDAGFVVYSVGINRKDDGGLLSWERTDNNWEKRDEPMAVYPSWDRSRESSPPVRVASGR